MLKGKKMHKNKKESVVPDLDELRQELHRVKYRQRYSKILKSTVYTLVVVAACAVLVATIWLPVLQIYGTSMLPTLNEDEIVVSVKGAEFNSGDMVCFYIGNKILVKRFIAGPGQWVDIDEDGNIYVDGEYLDEPYIKEKAFGDCNIELPYQVPESRIFVLGDNREQSIDSRNTAVGCIADEQIMGKIVFRVWPFDRFGSLR